MKIVILTCFLGLAAFALARPGEDPQYTSKYDNVNLDEIMHNDALFTAYVNCVLEVGKCTPDGKELKSHIREALENNCAKCTDAQKEGTRKVIKHLIKNKPEYWNQLKAKYDPKGEYERNHADDLKDL